MTQQRCNPPPARPHPFPRGLCHPQQMLERQASRRGSRRVCSCRSRAPPPENTCAGSCTVTAPTAILFWGKTEKTEKGQAFQPFCSGRKGRKYERFSQLGLVQWLLGLLSGQDTHLVPELETCHYYCYYYYGYNYYGFYALHVSGRTPNASSSRRDERFPVDGRTLEMGQELSERRESASATWN